MNVSIYKLIQVVNQFFNLSIDKWISHFNYP